jgi:hypothetical protein
VCCWKRREVGSREKRKAAAFRLTLGLLTAFVAFDIRDIRSADWQANFALNSPTTQPSDLPFVLQ